VWLQQSALDVLSTRKSIKHLEDLGPHIYVKTVLYCPVFFYIALVEFAFGVVKRGMTGTEPSFGDVVMLGFFYSVVTGVKMHH